MLASKKGETVMHDLPRISAGTITRLLLEEFGFDVETVAQPAESLAALYVRVWGDSSKENPEELEELFESVGELETMVQNRTAWLERFIATQPDFYEFLKSQIESMEVITKETLEGKGVSDLLIQELLDELRFHLLTILFIMHDGLRAEIELRNIVDS